MGHIKFTLTEQIRDTIATHGLRWAMAYYSERMTTLELRVFMRGAYLSR